MEQARTSWLLATALGSYFERHGAPSVPPNFACVATDGSLVASDRHGPLTFAIVNIGHCVLEYGARAHAQLGSEPTVLWRDDDLWIADGARRIPVAGSALAVRRAVMELEAAWNLATKQDAPVVVLQDGTLIPWGLEGQLAPVVSWALERFGAALATFRERKIPVAGFISYPGSRDVLNVLRVAACDYPLEGRPVNCDDCTLRVQRGERQRACRIVPELTDRWLFRHCDEVRLEAGERSGCYRSRSTILQHLPEPDRIVFFYLHTGTEVARVEVPLWVAEDEQVLALVHAVVWDQCRRARGYPLALQEAHEQAVIHQDQRRQIESLLDRLFAETGVVQERSAKERSKRVRFA
ncbi:MAG: DNA double-strand break repair nuclease NurA [Thermomicrobium sp.]|nr:DNA double-strand break repair nuclease NurA [Thermomicrobium sp.]